MGRTGWIFKRGPGAGGSPPTPFVVLFPGRTGSSWLISCLGSHPAIHAEGEQLVRRSPRRQRRWIADFYAANAAGGVRARGFKTKLKDVWDLDAFRDILRDRSVRVIKLSRRNVIKHAVSTINAQRLRDETGRWNRSVGTAPLPAFELTPEDLARAVEDVVRRDEQLSAYVEMLALPRLELWYEDLLTGLEERLGALLEFLDIPRAPMASDLVKNTDDDLRRVLLNFDELRSGFADGPYAEMFG